MTKYEELASNIQNTDHYLMKENRKEWKEAAEAKAIVLAMKIQHQLKATLDAKIESVAVHEGQQVSNRTILVTMAADAAAH